MLTLPDTWLVTDGRGDADRIRRIASAAIRGGVRGVQVREPGLGARALRGLCADLKPQLDAVAGMLVVNDRADVVAAGFAHGVQLGRRSLAPAEVRAFLPATATVGCSVHDAAGIEAGQAADYLVLAPLFATACKPGVPPLGAGAAAALVAVSARPVILLGGVNIANAAAARRIGASGIAVMSTLCDAVDPEATAAALVAAVDPSPA